MFYVSTVKNSNCIGVTDTKDGVEEFLHNKQLVELCKKYRVVIYGSDIYNNIAECIPIKLDQQLNFVTLTELIDKWRECHNPWTGIHVRDYLASSKIGTIINVDYWDYDTSHRKFSGCASLRRLSYDEWLFIDRENAYDGQHFDTAGITDRLEGCTIYMHCKRIRIK